MIRNILRAVGRGIYWVIVVPITFIQLGTRWIGQQIQNAIRTVGGWIGGLVTWIHGAGLVAWTWCGNHRVHVFVLAYLAALVGVAALTIFSAIGILIAGIWIGSDGLVGMLTLATAGGIVLFAVLLLPLVVLVVLAQLVGRGIVAGGRGLGAILIWIRDAIVAILNSIFGGVFGSRRLPGGTI